MSSCWFGDRTQSRALMQPHKLAEHSGRLRPTMKNPGAGALVPSLEVYNFPAFCSLEESLT